MLRSAFRALARGTALAACAAAASWAVAALGFRRDYYLAVLLPLCMVAFALVAWLSYLRDDGFAVGRGRPRPGAEGPEPPATAPEEPFRAGAAPAEAGAPERGGAPPAILALLSPRDDVVLPRAPGPSATPRAGRPRSSPWGEGRALRAALGVAACELGLLAAALYSLAGVGAAFFR